MFLRDAKYQFIDDCGRLRMLTYTDHSQPIYLFTPPLHPLAKDTIPDDVRNNLLNLVDLPSYEDAMRFADRYSFVLNGVHPVRYTSPEDKEDEDRSDSDAEINLEIDGVWLSLDLPSTGPMRDYYIPTRRFHKSNVEIRNEEPPIWIVETSYEGIKTDIADVISNILEQTAVRCFIVNNRRPLREDDFYDDEDYIVNISKRLSNASLPMFLYLDTDSELLFDVEGDNESDGHTKVRIPMVNDPDLRTELITSLTNAVSLVSDDAFLIKEYSEREIIMGRYNAFSSFRKSPDFCIFENVDDMETYRDHITGAVYSIREKVDRRMTQPYVFSDGRITHNNIALIQNVHEGKMSTARTVVVSWKKNRTNPGYFGIEDSDDLLALGDLNNVTLSEVLEDGEHTPESRPDIIIYNDHTAAAILYL